MINLFLQVQRLYESGYYEDVVMRLMPTLHQPQPKTKVSQTSEVTINIITSTTVAKIHNPVSKRKPYNHPVCPQLQALERLCESYPEWLGFTPDWSDGQDIYRRLHRNVITWRKHHDLNRYQTMHDSPSIIWSLADQLGELLRLNWNTVGIVLLSCENVFNKCGPNFKSGVP